ncbi:SDR family NAD(P)-dependent oxidoreductase [Saccharopolyspora sp. 5N708]|uniref:SDR family NAD(P)-dependent oxidoreductase n=1 Tax=Saccharopolyspora sp. 5N708 TaxID=3457424 RepID=UPI003FD056E5
MVNLSGKKALVTGAGIGIGRGIAIELARAGADVAVHYPPSEEPPTTTQRITELGQKTFAVEGDLREPEVCRDVVDRAADALGGLDILVNNAGVTRFVEFLDIDPELFDDLFHLNIRGYFFCAQQAVRHFLAAGGGSIVNLSSINGSRGFPRAAAYAATKGAVDAFTRVLSTDLAPRGIRVNAIAPGSVETPRSWVEQPDYSREAAAQRIPVRRVGLPADMGRVAAFLASEDAGYISGQVIHVDGGSMALGGG